MKRLHVLGMGNAGRIILEKIDVFFPSVESIFCYDDDTLKIGSTIAGHRVKGSIDKELQNQRFNSMDAAILAMPSAKKQRIADLYFILRNLYCECIYVLPNSATILEGDVFNGNIHRIRPEDVIGRPFHPLQLGLHQKQANTKTVLITGAGGSLGSELAKQALWLSFKHIYLLGHGETSIVRILRTLQSLQREGLSPDTRITPLIVDMKDKMNLRHCLHESNPDIVIHTAAHKHVLLMESNPYSAFANNIVSMIHLFEILNDMNVDRILHVSTDKATQPRSIYGKSKIIAEELALNTALPTTVVRFGNILSSRGSLSEVIENHSPSQSLQLTDPESERYYMSASEAASLILRVIFDGDTHTIYGLEMGEPVKLRDMADMLLRFFFPHAHRSIETSYEGLAKSENFSEMMTDTDEIRKDTNIPRVQIIEHRDGTTNIPNPLYYKELCELLIDTIDPGTNFSELFQKCTELKVTNVHHVH